VLPALALALAAALAPSARAVEWKTVDIPGCSIRETVDAGDLRYELPPVDWAKTGFRFSAQITYPELSFIIKAPGDVRRCAAVDAWAASLSTGTRAQFWNRAGATMDLLEAVAAAEPAEFGASFRAYALNRLFGPLAGLGRDAVFAAPWETDWVEPWRRLDRLRLRLAGDPDRKVATFIERYTNPPPGGRTWEQAQAEYAAVRERMAADEPRYADFLESLWLRVGEVRQREAASAAARSARLMRECSGKLGTESCRLVEREIRRFHANLEREAYDCFIPRVLYEEGSLAKSPKEYGLFLSPFRMIWPDFSFLYGPAAPAAPAPAAGRAPRLPGALRYLPFAGLALLLLGLYRYLRPGRKEGRAAPAEEPPGPEPEPEPGPSTAPAVPEPDELARAYAVLGLQPGATREQIRKAYHGLMTGYHPDKVAHLGVELRRLAEQKARELNEAYQRLERL